MPDTKFQPQTLSKVHAKCVDSVLSSVLMCIAVAAVFWAIDFGAGSSPSVSRLLVTVTMPALIFRDLLDYFRAKRRFDFVQPSPAGASSA
ncbi:hypothetical protein [Brevibacterium sp. UCMA 11754]|uniref:hypothetical protein n=1 Tax=Brevibacterium sp. UCMA 11754 TaxID=2749198 RepID=UPI001F20FF5B|nr:hypothetical protein [Brevibacterium sp. UCMA 11754]MCF2572907.1 hypothetical protein [Brevibacterium sp. UCMA 11754]